MARDSNCVKKVRQAGGATVIELAGEVDLHHVPEVHKALVAACDKKPPRLVINLESVSYMDSSGLGTLVEVFRRVKAYGGQLGLCGLNQRVRSVFEITKLDQFFEIHSTEAEALGG